MVATEYQVSCSSLLAFWIGSTFSHKLAAAAAVAVDVCCSTPHYSALLGLYTQTNMDPPSHTQHLLALKAKIINTDTIVRLYSEAERKLQLQQHTTALQLKKQLDQVYCVNVQVFFFIYILSFLFFSLSLSLSRDPQSFSSFTTSTTRYSTRITKRERRDKERERKTPTDPK